MWRIILLIALGCGQPVIPEPNKEHYLILRCRWMSQCDSSLKYMSEILDCKFAAGGRSDDGILTRIYVCEKRQK